MLRKILHFFSYHNAVPLGVAFLLLATGGALAADPDVRENVSRAVVSSEQKMTSVDNSYIRTVDLDAFAPKVRVVSVTEDDDAYYVEYTFETIALADGVWQPALMERTLTVKKDVLGERDLGLHVSKELRQLVDRELAKLRETQAIERKAGEQRKVVATAYSGLVGKFLDTKEESFDGYQPVKPPPAPPERTEPRAVSDSSGASPNKTTSPKTSKNSGAPMFQVLGNNPALVPLGSNWRDLGAYVTDDKNPNIGYETIGAGAVDVQTIGEYTITYRAVDQDGNVGTAQRLVIVYDPDNPPDVQQNANTGTDDSSSTGAPTDSNTDTSANQSSQDTTPSSTQQQEQPAEETSTTTSESPSESGTQQDSQDTATTTQPVPEEEPEDTTSPVITLLGEAEVTIEQGTAYADAGATASDDTDGDVSDSIVTTGAVDVDTVGDYQIAYDVSDSAGNAAATVTRIIRVVAPPEPEPESEPANDTATSTDTSTNEPQPEPEPEPENESTNDTTATSTSTQ